MDNISITRGTSKIEMPRIRKIVVGGEEVCKEITMANGKLVKEMIGFRTVLTAEWDWLPAGTIKELHQLLRQGGYFHVEYPDPVAGSESGLFNISYPESKIFKFEGTNPRWHEVKLTMTAQEVT